VFRKFSDLCAGLHVLCGNTVTQYRSWGLKGFCLGILICNMVIKVMLSHMIALSIIGLVQNLE
jgi:hypothetical protein